MYVEENIFAPFSVHVLGLNPMSRPVSLLPIETSLMNSHTHASESSIVTCKAYQD